MAKLTLGPGDAGEPVEVDVFGVDFTLRPVTRSVQKVLEKTDEQITAATTGDQVVDAVAEALGAMLAPANGRKVGAKKLIADRWKADELSLQEVTRFFEELQTASIPPT